MHEQIDDPFRPRGEVRRMSLQTRTQQRHERSGSDAARGAAEELAAGRFKVQGSRSKSFCHGFVIVSSRLKIILATVVQAANSDASSDSSRSDSPTLNRFIAWPTSRW